MVEELLNRGKENAITTEELMRACNMGNRRDLTLQVAHERAAGALICSTTSGHGGYYLPNSREEALEFIESMSRRAKNTFKAIKAARMYIKQIDGQMSIEELQEEK